MLLQSDLRSSWGARSDGRALPYFFADNGLLDRHFLTELLQGVLSLHLLELCWSVLVQELIN